MCTSPMVAYRNPNGGKLLFKSKKGFNGKDYHQILYNEIEIGCGQCLDCRIKIVRNWATRMVNEMEMYEIQQRDSYMLTLTYENENLPTVYAGKKDTGIPTLSRRDIDLFHKRLRERLRRKGLEDYKYFACGEYGDDGQTPFGRPHYHVMLMGVNFNDKYLWSKSETGNPVYRSDFLDGVWCFGLATLSSANFSSAEYCVKDVLKRITESDTEGHKKWLKNKGLENLEQYYEGRVKEFHTCSNNPGIGSTWIDKYGKYIFPNGTMPKVNGVRLTPPRYYKDRWIEKERKRLINKPDKEIMKIDEFQWRSKTETQKVLSSRNVVDKLNRRSDYGDRIISKNNIQKKRRRDYESFRSANKSFFDI